MQTGRYFGLVKHAEQVRYVPREALGKTPFWIVLWKYLMKLSNSTVRTRPYMMEMSNVKSIERFKSACHFGLTLRKPHGCYV